jgi:hypothetical protein
MKCTDCGLKGGEACFGWSNLIHTKCWVFTRLGMLSDIIKVIPHIDKIFCILNKSKLPVMVFLLITLIKKPENCLKARG